MAAGPWPNNVTSPSGCAGRVAAPVQTVQLKDSTMDCDAITAEIAADTAQQAKLSKESGEKVTQNVVAGVGGAILFWPALFLMDFQGAADKESKALELRGISIFRRWQRNAARPYLAPVAVQSELPSGDAAENIAHSQRW